MGFTRRTFDDYKNSSSRSGSALLYRISLDPKNGGVTKDLTVEVKNHPNHGEIWSGFYKRVWILSDLTKLSPITFHNQYADGKQVRGGATLCGHTLGVDCPICATYSSLDKTQRKSYKFTASKTVMAIPVLSIEEQDKPVITQGKQHSPVYLFELPVTSYIDEHRDHFQQLMEAVGDDYTECPTRIFSKRRGENEKSQYLFKSMKYKDTDAITCDHPLVADYLNDDGSWSWDKDHADLVFALAAVTYKPIVSDDGVVYDYGGQYPELMELFKTVQNNWPAPRIQVANYAPTDDDD